ncbi:MULTISPECIES: hypothetical protein [unclassified Aureimonas]|uniref:hypothetical protein n=1 Tax=unclassified Aureimonas TaxID=2615206 RepID=UPI0006F55494|nr:MULTISPECIES: hypothetical protein [unclassified Aureimonas]KQT52181.1 hypothetical protein ASG62_16110 [Aureimonas sp. Leaf427]KQT70586.1 hypothetical protein ASG54_21840 [Aureimonas sp. Leaf460]
MGMLSSLMIHGVTAVELTSAMPDNGNSRTLTISTADGELSITLFGSTDALEGLPRAARFRVLYAEPEVHALAEAAE